MKYKVGDKVKIKSIEWYNANANEYGSIEGTENDFTNDMSKYCGKLATIVHVGIKFYNLDIDDLTYYWYEWMFENYMSVKILKADIPNGCEINEEKSTNIIWNFIYNGVEIDTKDEHFIIKCDVPAFYCNWNDAQRYIQDIENWTMPSINQIKTVEKYLDEINTVIHAHCGYEICGKRIWSYEQGTFPNTAKSIIMDKGFICYNDKNDCQNVVILVKNI